MAQYKKGPGEKSATGYFDPTQTMVNKEYFLEFFHVPTANYVQFKGMITSFKDKFNSTWTNETGYGRSDPIGMFKNTQRTISIAWDVVAASEGEAKDNLGRVSLLVKMLYPSYDATPIGASALSTAPLLKFSFANLVQNYGGDGPVDNSASGGKTTAVKSSLAELGGLLGYVEGGVEVSPTVEEGFFDPRSGKLYPKSYKMSLNFVVLHTHELGWTFGKREFRTKNFPYGEEFSGGAELSESPFKNSKALGTPARQQATEKKMTGPTGAFAGARAGASISGGKK